MVSGRWGVPLQPDWLWSCVPQSAHDSAFNATPGAGSTRCHKPQWPFKVVCKGRPAGRRIPMAECACHPAADLSLSAAFQAGGSEHGACAGRKRGATLSYPFL